MGVEELSDKFMVRNKSLFSNMAQHVDNGQVYP